MPFPETGSAISALASFAAMRHEGSKTQLISGALTSTIRRVSARAVIKVKQRMVIRISCFIVLFLLLMKIREEIEKLSGSKQ
jgi:hypothetical protein